MGLLLVMGRSPLSHQRTGVQLLLLGGRGCSDRLPAQGRLGDVLLIPAENPTAPELTPGLEPRLALPFQYNSPSLSVVLLSALLLFEVNYGPKNIKWKSQK